MINLTDIYGKQKLLITGYLIIAINFIIYICLIIFVKCFISYDLFNKSVQLNDIILLILPFSNCLLIFLIIASRTILDTKAEPMYSIFKTTVKCDFYTRLFVVIVTITLIKTMINLNNQIYLYL